jgi:hypothetical protein
VDVNYTETDGAVYTCLRLSPLYCLSCCVVPQDLVDLERRSQAAELRHQELSAKLPEAARPLLRQIEAMQVRCEGLRVVLKHKWGFRR